LLKFLHTFVCYVCAGKAYLSKMYQLLKKSYLNIRESGAGENQGVEFTEPFEIRQAVTSDIGPVKPQHLKVPQPFEMTQANVCDSRVLKG
jgi:hypothetical protein